MQFLKYFFIFRLDLEFVNVIADVIFFFFSIITLCFLWLNISSYFLIGYFVNCLCLLACSGKPAAMMYLCDSQFYLRHVVWTQTAVVTTTFAEENESSQKSERNLVVMKVSRISLGFFFAELRTVASILSNIQRSSWAYLFCWSCVEYDRHGIWKNIISANILMLLHIFSTLLSHSIADPCSLFTIAKNCS